jgi:hypothetical protein
VERKVRMVPIVERVTHPSVCYVRIHRRRGNDKLLTPAELDAWATRLRRLGRLLGAHGRVYVMMNTNFEDQGIQNAVNLAQRLPDLGTTPAAVSVACRVRRVWRVALTLIPFAAVPDWKAMQEEDAQQAKRHFMSMLFAGAAKTATSKKAESVAIGGDDHDDSHRAEEEEVEANEEGHRKKDEEAEVQIVGHGRRAKEQRTIDDLFQQSKKRKRGDDKDEEEDDVQPARTAATGTNGSASPSKPAPAPTAVTSPAAKKKKVKTAPKTKGVGQASLQRFLSAGKA